MHARSEGSGFFRKIIGALLIVLPACAPISIPMHQPAPFSTRLEAFLEQPWVSRQQVHDWLGEPSATRLDGQLEIFIAQQEVAREYPRMSAADNTYHYHYLLVEYDGQDQVRRHALIVNAGCTGDGICVLARKCEDQGDCPDDQSARLGQTHKTRATEAELLQGKIDYLTVYATPAEDEKAKSESPEPGKCRVYVFRDPALPQVKVKPSGVGAVSLPVPGYLVWDSAPGELRIQFDWSDWNMNYQSRFFDFVCPAGQSIYLRVVMQRVKKWGWRYDLEMQTPERQAAREILSGKWLVLQ